MPHEPSRYPHIDGFIPLPSNPDDLTQEHIDAIFPPENRHVLREVVAFALAQHNAQVAHETGTTESNPDTA